MPLWNGKREQRGGTSCAAVVTAPCFVAERTEQIGLKPKGIKKKKRKGKFN